MAQAQPPQISANASGWDAGELYDGMRLREAARVLILDPAKRVLLARGHDSDRPDRQWWFTIGGGLDPQETAADAAVREVFEETGIKLNKDQLIGPVIERTAIFDFAAEHCVQHEFIYLVELTETPQLNRAGWTDVERDFLEDMAWLSAQEIAASEIEVFPENLAELVANLSLGWDGTLVNLGMMND